jgi:hypothetical protein
MGHEKFVDGLKRDKARGTLAPHQIILLITLYKLYSESKSNTVEIADLALAFGFTWKEHQNSFKTKNCNLGMPLKVFVNRDYLKIEIIEDIIDFRNKTELKSKINNIKINQVLLNLLIDPEFSIYLKTRISS